MKTISKNILAFFFNQGKLRNYKARKIISYLYQAPRIFFFIKSGYVKIYSITKHDGDKLYGIYKPGDIFPLHWESNRINKKLYYQSITAVSLYQISKKDFKQFLHSNPHAVFEILDKLSMTTNFFLERLDNLEIRMSYPKVIRRLLFLAERLGKKIGQSTIIQVKITHKEIGDSIAIARETVSRHMKEMEKKRLIQLRRHFIKIPDLQKLKTELSSYYQIDES